MFMGASLFFRCTIASEVHICSTKTGKHVHKRADNHAPVHYKNLSRQDTPGSETRRGYRSSRLITLSSLV